VDLSSVGGAAVLHDDDPEIVELWQEFGIPVAIVLDCGGVVVVQADVQEL